MRPYIICHMGSSIDGRLHPSRFTSAATGVSPTVSRGHYERIHDTLDADGWIVGRKTMSEMAKGTERHLSDAPKLPRESHAGNHNGRKLAIGIDPSGRVRFGKDNVVWAAIMPWLFSESRSPTPVLPNCAGMACRTYLPAAWAMIWRARWSASPQCSG